MQQTSDAQVLVGHGVTCGTDPASLSCVNEGSKWLNFKHVLLQSIYFDMANWENFTGTLLFMLSNTNDLTFR